MSYVETRTKIPVDPKGGYVTVAVDTTIPQRVNFGLALESEDGSQTPVIADGQFDHPYMLGAPAALKGKFLVCSGRVVDPNHGKFEVHCDFFQGGKRIDVTSSVEDQATENFEDFGIICELQ
jgi:hypothetical protein